MAYFGTFGRRRAAATYGGGGFGGSSIGAGAAAAGATPPPAGSTALVAGAALVVWYSKRRPVDQPLTWGEAMVAAWVIFLLMFVAYGIMPHQWLTFADNSLHWRKDKLLFGPGEVLHTYLHFTISYEA